MAEGPLARLYKQFQDGDVSRRDFIRRSAYLGVGAGMATFLANAQTIAAQGGSKNGWAVYAAQDGTPSATPGGGARPSIGTENQTRGEGGELKIIQWQAPTMANQHQSVGTKDFLIGCMVQEPLLSYLGTGAIIPNLVTEVPSVEAGSLAEDLMSCTFTLLEGLLWSDGVPVTSRDIQFTWEWVTNPDNAAVDSLTWEPIDSIEVVDERTATVHFKTGAANWFEPFTGSLVGSLIAAHAFNDEPKAENNPDYLLYPLGTGPFVITEFVPNDRVSLVANENYREPNKPFFASVAVKGGGDAPSAARAVLQTGDYQYAWNLQVEPAILMDLAGIEALGETNPDRPGRLVSEAGTSVERFHFNFSDPNTEVDGQRSEMNTPHPIFSDLTVRQAFNKAFPREVIATEFYGLSNRTTPNILTGMPDLESPNTSWEFNLDAAAQLLDEAGWVLNGDVREKDGAKLQFVYATSINQVRQKTQAVAKQALESIGVKVILDQVDAGTYFDGTAGNDRNIGHFFWDSAMWTNNPTSPVPASWFVSWYAGEDRSNIAQASNGWQGQNYQRYVSPEFDELYDSLVRETSLEKAAQICIQMNDVLINDVCIIPLVNRSSDTYAIAQNLIHENVDLGVGFELNYWNIANWRYTAE